MKKLLLSLLLISWTYVFAQDKNTDSTEVYKKRVLETFEIELLNSYYKQNGNNAAVTGGIGTEELSDITPTIRLSIPLNDDDILTIDAGISAYSSASSSNLDPFDNSGASTGHEEDDDDYDKLAFDDDDDDDDDDDNDDDDDDDDDDNDDDDDDDDDDNDDDDDDDDDNYGTSEVNGSPWVESSGASKQDIWLNGSIRYSHSSDDRNQNWHAKMSYSSEYDYTSFGFGAGISKLFNKKNTELNIKGSAYIDQWKPKYPTEIDSYFEADQDLNKGFFQSIDILNQQGNKIDKNGTNAWRPFNNTLIQNTDRNTYTLSLEFSQILSKNSQLSIFVDLIKQQGWLANPMQRVYFSDRDNFYIGNPEHISNYTSRNNTEVFQLADDIERLPSTRFKLPIGIRYHHYINEFLVIRSYYRYYMDDWGVLSNTLNIELPVKINQYFTIRPTLRVYNQTQADYFAPFEDHISTQDYYTSDYDLSQFTSQQYGVGIRYTDLLTNTHIWSLGLKSIDFKFSHYDRSTGLHANIISFGVKFVMDTKK